MKIEYVRAKNFLCVGEEGLEINFDGFGNIIRIQGRNLDLHDDEEDYSESGNEYHSNASGKSTLAEMIVYGLYGNTIRKKVTHNTAIHNQIKKKLEVEVIFTIGTTRYRILRTRKPDKIRLWHGGPPWIDASEEGNNEMTIGGQPATQTHIEESILGMNHKAFVNVVCFGQHNDYNFLECEPKEQRAIAESLLSLEIYNEYLDTAKNKVKDLKANLKEQITGYEEIKDAEGTSLKRISQIEKRHEDWVISCEQDIVEAKQYLVEIENQMANTDLGAALLEYETAQEKILITQDVLVQKDENEAKLTNALQQTQEHYNKISQKIHELRLQVTSVEREITDYNKDQVKTDREIKKLTDLPVGAKCPHCYGMIDKQHYKHVLQLHTNKKRAVVPKIEAADAKKKVTQLEIGKYEKTLNKLDQLKNVAEQKLSHIKESIQEGKSQLTKFQMISRPDLTSKELVLGEKITQAKKLIETKNKELTKGGPYLEILEGTRSDLAKIVKRKGIQKAKIKETEELIPYYQYYVKVFGPEGIRSFIIEGIVPALNARIAYWMEFLINGKMLVTFDKHLHVTITSNPPTGETDYFTTCGGERKRINLAISQAFAHVMMLSSGTWPSVVFLDEISDSIDQRGIKSIYRMICALSEEKQVFVITHNVHLNQMLEGVNTVIVQKENGFTTRLQ